MKEFREEFEKETGVMQPIEDLINNKPYEWIEYWKAYSEWLEQKIIDERKGCNDLLELEKIECQQAMQVMYAGERTAYKRGQLEERSRVLKATNHYIREYSGNVPEAEVNRLIRGVLRTLKKVVEEKSK